MSDLFSKRNAESIARISVPFIVISVLFYTIFSSYKNSKTEGWWEEYKNSKNIIRKMESIKIDEYKKIEEIHDVCSNRDDIGGKSELIKKATSYEKKEFKRKLKNICKKVKDLVNPIEDIEYKLGRLKDDIEGAEEKIGKVEKIISDSEEMKLRVVGRIEKIGDREAFEAVNLLKRERIVIEAKRGVLKTTRSGETIKVLALYKGQKPIDLKNGYTKKFGYYVAKMLGGYTEARRKVGKIKSELESMKEENEKISDIISKKKKKSFNSFEKNIESELKQIRKNIETKKMISKKRIEKSEMNVRLVGAEYSDYREEEVEITFDYSYEGTGHLELERNSADRREVGKRWTEVSPENTGGGIGKKVIDANPPVSYDTLLYRLKLHKVDGTEMVSREVELIREGPTEFGIVEESLFASSGMENTDHINIMVPKSVKKDKVMLVLKREDDFPLGQLYRGIEPGEVNKVKVGIGNVEEGDYKIEAVLPDARDEALLFVN